MARHLFIRGSRYRNLQLSSVVRPKATPLPCTCSRQKGSSSVLILDEATSTVDNETQRSIVNVLETEFASHTIISIAHRLHTVRGFDVVMVLEHGQIVEIGPPNELLAKEGGEFRRMWDAEV